MKRKQIILVTLAATLPAVAAGIVVWWLLTPEPALSPIPTGHSAPIELVEIPPGEFLMGSPETEEGRKEDETQHRVRITYSFKMGKTEVTQKQWREVMGTTVYQQKNKKNLPPPFFQRIKEFVGSIIREPLEGWSVLRSVGFWDTARWLVVGKTPDSSILYGEDDDCPMYYVSWDEAMEFCRRLTEREREAGRLSDDLVYRLPTEAEWESVARGGPVSKGFIFSGSNELEEVGWYGGNSGGKSKPIGRKKPNELGVYDMTGNALEWCFDWYDGYPSGRVTDPSGPERGVYRVIRGGDWDSDDALCRVACRRSCKPMFTIYCLGFRVVLAPVRPAE